MESIGFAEFSLENQVEGRPLRRASAPLSVFESELVYFHEMTRSVPGGGQAHMSAFDWCLLTKAGHLYSGGFFFFCLRPCRDVPVCDFVQLHSGRRVHRSGHAPSERRGGLRGRQGVHDQSRHRSVPHRAEQRETFYDTFILKHGLKIVRPQGREVIFKC